ncbi:MAG: Gfo/Idh/MocA family oxidoreductase [Bacteroidota bacterium]
MTTHSTHKKKSRRLFIKTLTAGITTLGAAKPFHVIHAANRIRSKDSLGIALIGLGSYSTGQLLPALQETSHVKLTGIVTGTPAKAKSWSEAQNIPAANIYNYENFDSIAENPDIDIVYVVLPNSMHAEYSIRGSQAGKHVICEKPMASTPEECRQMIAAAKKANRTLSIGYRMQYEPTTQEIIRYQRENVMGDVVYVTAGAGYREGRKNHWKLKRSMSGGALHDMGVYSLNAARYATGEEPISVRAQTFTHRPELFNEVDETVTWQLEFPSGAVANLTTSFATGMNYLETRFRKGWYRLSPFQSYRGIKGEGSQGALNYPIINQQAAQMNETAQRILEGRPMRVPGEEGLKDMIVVEAIWKSIARDGAKVKL